MTRRLFTLVIFAVIGIISSVAMSIERAREEADFLTDKMAYELGLTESQWSDVYEINYDYFRSMNHLGRSYVRESELRDAKLRYVLTSVQWDKYCAINYFLACISSRNAKGRRSRCADFRRFRKTPTKRASALFRSLKTAVIF